MEKCKIVFKDGFSEKLVFGIPDFEYDETLLKIDTDRGNTVFVNKSEIIFIKELKEGT